MGSLGGTGLGGLEKAGGIALQDADEPGQDGCVAGYCRKYVERSSIGTRRHLGHSG